MQPFQDLDRCIQLLEDLKGEVARRCLTLFQDARFFLMYLVLRNTEQKVKAWVALDKSHLVQPSMRYSHLYWCTMHSTEKKLQ
jgi:hypothetical protein